MARRKTPKDKPAPPSEPLEAVEVTVTWRNTLNCDRSDLQQLDRKIAAGVARQAGYEFMAHNHRVFLLHPEEGPEALGKDASELDVGLLVRMTPDKKLLDVEPRPKTKFVVMAASYSYDDERHSREEGGFPKTIFDTCQEAEAEAARRSIEEVSDLDEPFDYMGWNESYDELVTMPYHAWYDWLKDRDIDPPTDNPDSEPDIDQLRGWWTEGRGGHTWHSGSYQDVPGTWTLDQRRYAATHLNVSMYDVEEVPYGSD